MGWGVERRVAGVVLFVVCCLLFDTDSTPVAPRFGSGTGRRVHRAQPVPVHVSLLVCARMLPSG